jgi:hypothetical protein
MPFIEAPTTFYLGKRFDPQTRKLSDEVVYYDSRDLTTHAVVVGMTGSGKTGLCINMLEEAILDNVPAIIIDPKGDITNLLLTFPDLRPEDFQSWVNVDDARRAGLDIPSYSADVAQRWRDGLASWGIVPDRLRWLQRAAKYSIFTPGSDAGLPISILASLRAPREGWAGNEEANREKINGITTALLALAGLNVEPIKDKEHVLVANIFEHAWQQGRDLTLEDIILQVQSPPFDKLGVFPIDNYISEKARSKLAMDLNNIIAAPSFQSWVQGQPMDIQSLLYQPNGRPRISIFYIAHLSDAERMFITTLILENMLGWMRTLSGTTSLRAILYIDEVYGLFPPYPKNPPTKEPMIRLLKQARAFGIGMILATQNPGDLDYKGLTNAGTWFIGRLQSDNDRQKVMDGLQSLASAEDNLDLRAVETLIADIAPRVFLMRNVHDDAGPVLVHTRWAMNFLRGPLTRQQVQALMHSQRQELMAQVAGGFFAQQAATPAQQALQAGHTQPTSGYPVAPPALPEAPYSAPSAQVAVPPPPPPLLGQSNFQQGWTQQATVPPSQANIRNPQDSQATAPGIKAPAGYSDKQPPISSATAQYFFPTVTTVQQAIAQWEQQMGQRAQGFGGSILAYNPVLFAQTLIRFQDRKANVYTSYNYAFHVPDLQRAGIVHWEQYQAPPVDVRQLSGQPFGAAIFGDLPPGLSDNSRMSALKRELVDMLFNTAKLVIPHNPTLGVFGSPDGDYTQFQSNVNQVAREKRDQELDKLSAKYGGMMDKLEERLRRKELERRAEERELKGRRRDELATTVESGLSLLKGNTKYTISRMTQASRLRQQAKEDLHESDQVIGDIERQMEAVEQEYEVALQQVNERWAQIAAQVQEYTVAPLKKDVQIEIFGIGWLPHWYMVVNQQPTLLPAY